MCRLLLALAGLILTSSTFPMVPATAAAASARSLSGKKAAEVQKVMGDWAKWGQDADTGHTPAFGSTSKLLADGQVLSNAGRNPVPPAFLTPGSLDIPDTCASVSIALALATSCTFVNTIHKDCDLKIEHCFGRSPGAGYIIIRQPLLLGDPQPNVPCGGSSSSGSSSSSQQAHGSSNASQLAAGRSRALRRRDSAAAARSSTAALLTASSIDVKLTKRAAVAGGKTGGDSRSPPASQHVQGTFRMRLVGPEILLLDVHYCSHGVAVGTYRASRPGDYSLEVLTLHTPFHYDVPSFVDQRTLYTARLYVTLAGFEAVSTTAGAVASASRQAKGLPASAAAAEKGHDRSSSRLLTGETAATGVAAPGAAASTAAATPVLAATATAVAATAVASSQLPLCSYEDASRGRFVSDRPLAELTFLYPTCFRQELRLELTFILDDMLPPCEHATMDGPTETLQPSLLRWEPYDCQLARYDTPQRRDECVFGTGRGSSSNAGSNSDSGNDGGGLGLRSSSGSSSNGRGLSGTGSSGASSSSNTSSDKRKFLCLIGDSHTRIEFNAFNDFFGHVGHVKASKGDMYVESEYAAYYWFADDSLDYPNGQWMFNKTHESTKSLDRCTHIIANLGFHQLSCGRPALFKDLLAFTSRYAARLAELATGGMHVYWQDTNGSPIRSRHIEHHRAKTTDPYIILLNKLTQSIMQQHGIPVLHTWAMQTVLSELIDDTRHFAATGPVLHAVTQLITHVFCELT